MSNGKSLTKALHSISKNPSKTHFLAWAIANAHEQVAMPQTYPSFEIWS